MLGSLLFLGFAALLVIGGAIFLFSFLLMRRSRRGYGYRSRPHSPISQFSRVPFASERFDEPDVHHEPHRQHEPHHHQAPQHHVPQQHHHGGGDFGGGHHHGGGDFGGGFGGHH